VKFAMFISLALMWIALIGCTLPAGQYSASVYLPSEIAFGGDTTPTREALPTWTAPTPQPARYVSNTTANAWNIRSEPRVTGTFYEFLLPGQQLELQAVLESGWLQVERVGGGSGYVDARCCADHQ
jgi:hypothetical protein